MTSESFSLIVPVYKEENTIIKEIKELQNILSKLMTNFELIVVVDGFEDGTYLKIKRQESKIKNLKVFGYERNMGKGYAIKYGVGKAQNKIIGFVDSGMDLELTEVPRMLDIMNWNNADIVIGSKLHPESKVEYPLFRKVLSWGYRTLTFILFGFKVRDTQVGLKIFKKKVAKEIFSRVLVKRFAFDIEMLAIAYSLGYHRIYEAPIKLNFKKNTINSFNFWITISWMLWDTMAVFYRLKILHYYDNPHK